MGSVSPSSHLLALLLKRIDKLPKVFVEHPGNLRDLRAIFAVLFLLVQIPQTRRVVDQIVVLSRSKGEQPGDVGRKKPMPLMPNW